jgi:hypothetical protein
MAGKSPAADVPVKEAMATDAVQALALAPGTDAGRGRLECLAEMLAQHGLRASLTASPASAPSLHVVNPEAPALAEDVYAGSANDGSCWFWWSWAERIAAGEDVEGAAARIKKVLAARD